MSAPKVIAVFGATGQQGGAVAQNLLKDSQYKVRAITRDPSKAQAQGLAKQGAEVVKADLNDCASLKEALRDVHGCFLVTDTNFKSADPEEEEFKQGENVADVCIALKINHIVFSTLPGVRDVTGERAQHWDAKARIYKFMKERDLPVTGIMLPFAYSNLLTYFRFQKVQEHVYKLGIPMGEMCLNMLDVGDLGKALHYIFNHQDECLSKTYSLVGDKRTVKEMCDILAKELRPNSFEDAKMTCAQMKAMHFPGSEDMANMFEYIQRGDLRFNLDTTKRLVPDVIDFSAWVHGNRDALLASLQ